MRIGALSGVLSRVDTSDLIPATLCPSPADGHVKRGESPGHVRCRSKLSGNLQLEVVEAGTQSDSEISHWFKRILVI